MRRAHIPLAVALAIASTSSACGWQFGPGASSESQEIFATPPVMVRRGDDLFLSWTYGRYGFFFQPRYEVIEGRLVFSLQGTSSSGSLSGRTGEIRIEEAEARAAFEASGAFWWEPDGTLVKLEERSLAAHSPGGSLSQRPWRSVSQ